SGDRAPFLLLLILFCWLLARGLLALGQSRSTRLVADAPIASAGDDLTRSIFLADIILCPGVRNWLYLPLTRASAHFFRGPNAHASVLHRIRSAFKFDQRIGDDQNIRSCRVNIGHRVGLGLDQVTGKYRGGTRDRAAVQPC